MYKPARWCGSICEYGAPGACPSMARDRLRPAYKARAKPHDVRPATEKESSVHDLTKRLASRASRRGVLKGGAALGFGAIGLGPLSSSLAAQGEDKLEVFSWWTSPGE